MATRHYFGRLRAATNEHFALCYPSRALKSMHEITWTERFWLGYAVSEIRLINSRKFNCF
jgi:hypothetical protein